LLVIKSREVKKMGLTTLKYMIIGTYLASTILIVAAGLSISEMTSWQAISGRPASHFSDGIDTGRDVGVRSRDDHFSLVIQSTGSLVGPPIGVIAVLATLPIPVWTDRTLR
jgi:hypothetical protein